MKNLVITAAIKPGAILKENLLKSFIVTLLSFLFVLFSGSAKADSTDTVKTVTIKVSGITCNGDMPVIKKKLINADGIDEVAYSKAKSGSVEFTITYHTSMITEAKIREIIEDAPSCDHPDQKPYKTGKP